jgi:translation elongation factor EF-Tu-like GTPase
VCKPGSLKTYKKFEAEIYVLTKDEGGWHTAFVTNYNPQFYFRTTDVTGRVELLGEMKMVLPGDNVTTNFELISLVPLEPGNDCILNFFRQYRTIDQVFWQHVVLRDAIARSKLLLFIEY